MNLAERVSGSQLKLSGTEKDILAFILANEAFVADSTVSALARQTFSSTSSVIRLTQKLGFEGYGELKYFIKDSLTAKQPATRDIVSVTRSDVAATFELIDNSTLDPVVSLLAGARTVYCFGTGYAQRLAVKDFVKSLMLSRKLFYIVPGANEFERTVDQMTPKDTVLIASLSGATSGLEQVMAELKLRGVPTICIAAQSGGYLALEADHTLYFASTPAVTRLQTGPFYSFVGLNVLLDVIARSLIVRLEEESGAS